MDVSAAGASGGVPATPASSDHAVLTVVPAGTTGTTPGTHGNHHGPATRNHGVASDGIVHAGAGRGAGSGGGSVGGAGGSSGTADPVVDHSAPALRGARKRRRPFTLLPGFDTSKQARQAKQAKPPTASSHEAMAPPPSLPLASSQAGKTREPDALPAMYIHSPDLLRACKLLPVHKNRVCCKK